MRQSHTLVLNINLQVSMSGCLVARTFLLCQTKLGLAGLDFPKAPCWSVDLITLFYWLVCLHITILTVWTRTTLAEALWRQVSTAAVYVCERVCVFFLCVCVCVCKTPSDSRSGSGESAVHSLCRACSSAVISGVSLIEGN